MGSTPDSTILRYGVTARALHWLTVLLIAVQFPIGLAMAWRGRHDLWDGTTDLLYTLHKSFGFLLLIVVLVRLATRLILGAPPPEPSLQGAQKLIATVVHWLLYALLVAVPVLGWLTVSLFPALDLFGGLSLPAITGVDRAASDMMARRHGVMAFALVGLAALHGAAALHHHFIRRDNVLRRMLP